MKQLFCLLITCLSIAVLQGQGNLVATVGQGMLDTGYVASNHSVGFFSTSNHHGFGSYVNEVGFFAFGNASAGFGASGSIEGISLSNNSIGVKSENNITGIYCVGNQDRAAHFIGDINSTYPAVEMSHENDSKADMHFGGTARITSEDEKGLSLPAKNRPLITREWDPFTSGNYSGIGRWGLFMETSRMVLGIPDESGREIEFAKYDLDGTRVKLAGINQAGEICASDHTTCSDIRYKRSVHFLCNSLEKIMHLRGVSYFWDQEQFSRFSDKKQIGFIAQEVEATLPELVSTDENGYKSISYDKVTPLLVEAIKEQQEQINALKEQNQYLVDVIEQIGKELLTIRKEE